MTPAVLDFVPLWTIILGFGVISFRFCVLRTAGSVCRFPR